MQLSLSFLKSGLMKEKKIIRLRTNVLIPANQLTGFYMIGTLVVKGLMVLVCDFHYYNIYDLFYDFDTL